MVIISLIDIFNKLGIKWNNTIQEKLKDDDITPRRLVRFFRFQIRSFLFENIGIASYLWKKYGRSVTMNDNMRHICFPGAEHLVESSEDIKFILATYNKLDEFQGTNFTLRITNVLISRGLVIV